MRDLCLHDRGRVRPHRLAGRVLQTGSCEPLSVNSAPHRPLSHISSHMCGRDRSPHKYREGPSVDDNSGKREKAGSSHSLNRTIDVQMCSLRLPNHSWSSLTFLRPIARGVVWVIHGTQQKAAAFIAAQCRQQEQSPAPWTARPPTLCNLL